MQDRSAAIREGMDVYDVDDDKVGTVGKVYQPTATSSTASGYAEPTGRAYLKVDTGLFGLGKDLFIPASAIRDVTADRVILNVDKDALDDTGWDRRPDWIAD